MEDLVFPSGNEESLANMAKKLGIRQLVFCYPLSDPHIASRKAEAKKLGCEIAVLVQSPKEIQKAKRVAEHVVAVGKPGIYEDKRIRYVIDFEYGRREDFIHHRNSGLTQVFIKKGIASGKVFLVNASGLLGPDRDVLLGRMMQNNRFFRKYRPDVLVISGAKTPLEMRSPRDLKNLLQLT